MNRNDLFDEIVNEVKRIIPDEIGRIADIELREVIKANDTRLHGLTIKLPDIDVSPMLYLEDCIQDYEKGVSVHQIAVGILASYAEHAKKTPEISLSLDYEDIRDKMVLELADASLNKERLRDAVYRSVGEGMVLIPYVVLEENESGTIRFMITKEMAINENYDVNRLFKDAMKSTMNLNAPVMEGMTEKLLFPMFKAKELNPYSLDFTLGAHEEMFVLTNESAHLGAAALYYPDMQQRIGQLMGESYYALPSSLHEFIIVPESSGISHAELVRMVKGANESVVADKDILSYRVFKYDIEKQKLMDPAAHERTGSERSDR